MYRPLKSAALRRILPPLAVIVAVLGAPHIASADEYDQFAIAKNAFDAGEYQEAVKRFDALLKSGLTNPSLIIETHKLLAISYLFTDNKAAAESQFTKLLTRAPDFNLDPLLYPIEVVDFFTKIKQKSKKQLEALAKAKAIEEANRKAREAERRKAEAERMKRNVYIEREVEKGSLLVAALPFGAGQFQNGDTLKGALFLSGELLLTGAAITFYFLHASLRDKTPTSPDERLKYEQRERVYRIGNHVSVGTLAAVGIAGLIDGILRFKRETVRWKNVEEKEVPDALKPHTSNGAKLHFSIHAGHRVFGLSLEGRF